MGSQQRGELPQDLRLQSVLLGVCIILWGLLNQLADLLDNPSNIQRPILLPMGVVLPGIFLAVAGIGVCLQHEWGFKLAFVLCLMQITMSIFDLSILGIAYIAVCLFLALGSWWLLRQTRLHAGPIETRP